MEDQANRNAWECIQQNKKYLDAYQEWCGGQFYYLKFTGKYYATEEAHLNEYGQKYAEDLFGVLIQAEMEKDNSEIKETLAEVEDMGFLSPLCFGLLRTSVVREIARLEYTNAIAQDKQKWKAINVHMAREQPLEDSRLYSKADLKRDFQHGLATTMQGLWVELFKAARPESPFGPDVWPLDPRSDYEEVKQYDLTNKDNAASFVKLSENGEILVKIDPKMQNKFISKRIDLIVKAVREKHEIKKVVRAGTLTGIPKDPFWIPKELLKKMETDLKNKLPISRIKNKYYPELKEARIKHKYKDKDKDRPDPPPDEHRAIYEQLLRWSKKMKET